MGEIGILNKEKRKEYNQYQILSLLASSQDGLRFKDFLQGSTKVDFSRVTLNDHLKDLIDTKLIKKESGRQGKYKITRKGRENLLEFYDFDDFEIPKSVSTIPYRLNFEENFESFTASGVAGFNLSAIPEEGNNEIVFDEEEEYFVLRIPKSLVEKSESYSFHGVGKKIEKKEGK